MTKRELGNSFDSARNTLKVAIGLMIHRVFLAEFTWTGKSKPGFPRKRSFQAHQGLFSLLLTIVSKLHPGYSKSILEKSLVKDVFKTAYE